MQACLKVLREPAKFDAGHLSLWLAIALVISWVLFEQLRSYFLDMSLYGIEANSVNLSGVLTSNSASGNGRASSSSSSANGPQRYSLEWFAKVKGSEHDVMLTISSGCSGYQNWQSETLMFGWARIRHPGRLTRIVSGCKSESEKQLAMKTGVPNDDGRILWYFTQDFAASSISGQGRSFVYFNKPNSMKQWIHSQRKTHQKYLSKLRSDQGRIQSTNNEDIGLYESFVVLLDPDFMILRPFLFHIPAYVSEFCNERLNVMSEGQGSGYDHSTMDQCNDRLLLREGHPVSQEYGIGSKWLHWGLVGDVSSLSEREAWNHYSVGPPYMMSTLDWSRMVDGWVDLSPAALEKEPPPSILAEMYSFSMACFQAGLPHELLKSMVSSPYSSLHSESFGVVNTLKPSDVYESMIPIEKSQQSSQSLKWLNGGPIHIIHMCQGFWLGKNRNLGTVRLGGWNFHKGHVPQKIMDDCEMPLLIEMVTDASLMKSKLRLNTMSLSSKMNMIGRLKEERPLNEEELAQFTSLFKDSGMLNNLKNAMNDANAKIGQKNKYGFVTVKQQQSSLMNEMIYKELIEPLELFEMREPPKDHILRNVWFHRNVYHLINEATLNYRRKYCPKGWKAQYGLVLEQPESDRGGRRMNYPINEFDSGKSWRGH